MIDTYNLARDGLADLVLSPDLEERLRYALDKPFGDILAFHLERDINECLLYDGGWDGDWSAVDIVETLLAGAVGLGWLASPLDF